MPISIEDVNSLRKHKIHRHKFGAISCERDQKKFPSKLERSCYDVLVGMRKSGRILFFLRQIPFDLPGSHSHKVDYCVFTPENVIFIEAKGRDLAIGKMKREQVEEIFGVKIFVVKSAGEIHEMVQTYG